MYLICGLISFFSPLAVSHGIAYPEEDILNTLDHPTSNYDPYYDDIYLTDEFYSDNYYTTQDKVHFNMRI